MIWCTYLWFLAPMAYHVAAHVASHVGCNRRIFAVKKKRGIVIVIQAR